jgi:glycerol-3-phosphate dehydrogenase
LGISLVGLLKLGLPFVRTGNPQWRGETVGSTDTVNVVIIGGGILGIAVAAEVSRSSDDVFLLEALPRLGLGASTRNSGVIHAGIYYSPGSLKAKHCVEGSRLLYQFCAEHRVAHSKIGKLIVADTEEHLPELEKLKTRGDENGVEGLEIVGRDFIKHREPNLGSPVAIFSPNTGIVDAEELIRALARVAEGNGASLLTNTRVIGAEVRGNVVQVQTQRETVTTRVVVNAAGLYSDEIAKMLGFDRYTIHPCRGEYAELPPSRSHLINGLVYPLPLPTGHGLGVHFTRTLGGALLLGPNSKYVSSKDDYEEERTPLSEFYESASRMLPMLRPGDLRQSYSGIRARLLPEDDHSFADFVITRDPSHQFVIHLIGIESPGLTSALSIARSVADMVRQGFD